MSNPRRDVPVPKRLANRPRDDRDYIVPFFVGYVGGKPDFRTIEAGRVGECVRGELCWLCGTKLGTHRWFVVGPMCIANRLSSEPPSHFECAEYAAKVCPHLINPGAKRREANLPTGISAPAGIGIKRNPGTIVMWESRNYKPRRTPEGLLFNIGDPASAPLWWTEGRRASREEAIAAFEQSCETLSTVAAYDAAAEGSEAPLRYLEQQIASARQFLPAEAGA